MMSVIQVGVGRRQPDIDQRIVDRFEIGACDMGQDRFCSWLTRSSVEAYFSAMSAIASIWLSEHHPAAHRYP